MRRVNLAARPLAMRESQPALRCEGFLSPHLSAETIRNLHSAFDIRYPLLLLQLHAGMTHPLL